MFSQVLSNFLSHNDLDSWIRVGSEPGSYGKIGGALSECVLLREDKAELDTSGDPYMKIARGLQAFVALNRTQHSDHGKLGCKVSSHSCECVCMYLKCFSVSDIS
jgi:hypothetical protein